MDRFSSRSGENAALTRRVTRKRVPRGPRKRTLEYVEEADRAERWQGGWFRRCSRELMHDPGHKLLPGNFLEGFRRNGSGNRRGPARAYCGYWVPILWRKGDELFGIAEESKRIQWLTVQAHFIVKMGAGGTSCRTHIANDISLFDLLTHLDRVAV